MLEQKVRKIIARYGEREVVACSVEEMHYFITDHMRPSFNDDSIIAIKFIIGEDEDISETSWFINPIYSWSLAKLSSISSGDELMSDFLYYYTQPYT